MFKIYMLLLEQNNTNIGLKIYKATAFSQENTKVPTAGGLVCSSHVHWSQISRGKELAVIVSETGQYCCDMRGGRGLSD